MRRTAPNDDLSAWLDGELDPESLAELEAELARDPELREELAELEAAVGAMREHGPRSAPIGFTQRVLDRVAAEEPKERFWSWLRRPWGIPLEGWLLGAAVAAAVLLLLPRGGREAPEQVAPVTVSPAALSGEKQLVEELLGSDPGAGGEVGSSVPAPNGQEPGTEAPPVEPVAAGEKRIGSPGSEPVELFSPGSDPRDFAGSPGADPGESEQLREASGTAKIEDPAAPLPAPAGVGDAPPAPASKQAVEPGRAPIHLVVTSEDPAMKREILALAARWGEATTPAGERIVDGRMSGSAETVAFTVPQADLTELTLQLKKYGYEVSVKSYADSLVGTTVDVLLTLRLVEGTGAAPEAPAELLLDEE